MFSLAQASVSLMTLQTIPMLAMFNLLCRCWPRKSVGTPNASAPAAREVVFRKSRRLVREGKRGAGEFNRGNFFALFRIPNKNAGRGGGTAGAMRFEAILEWPQRLEPEIGRISGTPSSRRSLAGMRRELTLPATGKVLISECRTVIMPGVPADTVPGNAAPG